MYISHPKHVPFEYNKITENIFLGTNQCCKVHFKKSLLKKGIKADVSLEKERIDAAFGVDYFLWLPGLDKKSPTQKQLMIGAKAIKEFVESKIKVYVHCKRGHGRSPTLVAAYFILMGLNVAEAVKKIKKKRGIHMTLPQIKALNKFEKVFKGKGL